MHKLFTPRTVALGFLTPAWFEFCKESEFEKGARVVRTVNQPVLVPAVLLLRGFDRMLMQEMKFNRQNLLERDDYQCQYCGKSLPNKELNMDHVIPRDRGRNNMGKCSDFLYQM